MPEIQITLTYRTEHVKSSIDQFVSVDQLKSAISPYLLLEEKFRTMVDEMLDKLIQTKKETT